MNAPCRRAAAALLILGSSAACAQGPAVSVCPPDPDGWRRPQGDAWHHGPIVTVDSASEQVRGYGRGSRQLLVQVKPAGNNTGRIWFAVNESTHLVCRSGARLSPSAPLAPGMMVSARAPMIMESDPGQAFADTLIVGADR